MLYFQPKVVTAVDEAELARKLERAEMENAEISGDEDSDESEEGLRFDGEGEGNVGDFQSGSDDE